MKTSSVVLGVVALVALAVVWSATYTVPEGHVGIVTRFGAAISQSAPGLNVKLPFVDGVRLIEVRERKTVEELAAATNNQLPITATVSANWTVQPSAALELFQRYGALEQFQDRIFDPRLRQAAKSALADFNADELIRNRNAAIGRIQEELTALLADYPVTVNSPQIENVDFPASYEESVLAKEKAREDAAREQYNLERQKLEAQRSVQTAEAERDAQKALADGNAYRVKTEAAAEAEAIRLRGDAEAAAVEAVQKAIAGKPLLVQYEKAKRWDGALPRAVLPTDTVPFLDVAGAVADPAP